MVMKIRSFWKMLIGVIVSLFVGGGMAAKADAKVAKPTSKKATVAQAPEARGKYTRTPTMAFPTSSTANVVFPSEVAAMRAEGVTFSTVPVGAAMLQRSGEAALTDRPVGAEGVATFGHPISQGEAAYRVILPKFKQGVQIISIDEADAKKFQDTPVIIVDKNMETGYFRIPITLPASEKTLTEEYNK